MDFQASGFFDSLKSNSWVMSLGTKIVADYTFKTWSAYSFKPIMYLLEFNQFPVIYSDL